MLDNFRKMEPLTPQEENRVYRKLRLAVIIIAASVLAYVIWSIVAKKGFSTIYYVLIGIFLVSHWILSDVAPIWLCRALAGRSKAQSEAYVKAALFGLLSDIGLGWFLIAMSNHSIYGALLYLLGVTFARKQREIYNSKEEETEEETEIAEEPEKTPEHLPTAADRLKRLNELSAQLDAEKGAEEPEIEVNPEIEENAGDTEEDDGSV